MITTVKETIKSVADKTYGAHIVQKTVKAVLWYWTRYVLLFAVIPLILVIILLTYFVPQLSKQVREHIPDGFISVTDGQLTASYSPAKYSSPNLVIQFDPQNSLPEDPASLPAGFYVFRDGLLQVDPPDSYRVQKFTDLPDFRLDKTQAVAWLQNHTLKLWLVLFLTSVFIWILLTSFFWAYKIASLVLWSAGFWLFGRLVKKPLPFWAAFKLVVYAAVPTLIISALLSVAPNPYLSYLNLGIFLFLSLSWLWNLPAKEALPAKAGPAKK